MPVKLSSSALVDKVMVACGSGRARTFRNNVGIAEYPNGSKVAYGLGKGSSDVVGVLSVTVTPEMVGHKVAVWFVHECKTGRGELTNEQSAFLDTMQGLGAIAAVVRSVEDAVGSLKSFCERFRIPTEGRRDSFR